jgi:hypothetical protein
MHDVIGARAVLLDDALGRRRCRIVVRRPPLGDVRLVPPPDEEGVVGQLVPHPTDREIAFARELVRLGHCEHLATALTQHPAHGDAARERGIDLWSVTVGSIRRC